MLTVINVSHRLVSWYPIVRIFCFLLEYLGDCERGSLYCEIFFSDPIFPGRALSTFIDMFLGKAGLYIYMIYVYTLEGHVHVKTLKMQGFPKNQMPY